MKDTRQILDYDPPNWTPGEIPEPKPIPFVRRMPVSATDSRLMRRVMLACAVLVTVTAVVELWLWWN